MYESDYVLLSNRDNLYGKLCTLTYVSYPKMKSKKAYLLQYGVDMPAVDIKKISRFQFHVRKQSYFDMINTSTGIVDMGVEVKQVGESRYVSEGVNQYFTEALKSDVTKKYINIRFNEKEVDTHGKRLNVLEVVYLDAEDKVVSKEDRERYLADYTTTTKSARTELVQSTAKVFTQWYNIEKIARLAIDGLVFVDRHLDKYNHLDETVFEAML